jgi:hypothetical protein
MLSVASALQNNALTYFCVQTEVQHIQQQASREQRKFDTAYEHWSTKMTKDLLVDKKLGQQWIVENDTGLNSEEPGKDPLTRKFYSEQREGVIPGRSFFNIKTGKSQEEHPHFRDVLLLRKNQRAAGQKRLGTQLAALQRCAQQLTDREENFRLRQETAIFEVLNTPSGV